MHSVDNGTRDSGNLWRHHEGSTATMFDQYYTPPETWSSNLLTPPSFEGPGVVSGFPRVLGMGVIVGLLELHLRCHWTWRSRWLWARAHSHTALRVCVIIGCGVFATVTSHPGYVLKKLPSKIAQSIKRKRGRQGALYSAPGMMASVFDTIRREACLVLKAIFLIPMKVRGL